MGITKQIMSNAQAQKKWWESQGFLIALVALFGAFWGLKEDGATSIVMAVTGVVAAGAFLLQFFKTSKFQGVKDVLKNDNTWAYLATIIGSLLPNIEALLPSLRNVSDAIFSKDLGAIITAVFSLLVMAWNIWKSNGGSAKVASVIVIILAFTANANANTNEMNIVKQHLPDGQYIKALFPKKNIVLHHTVSSNAQSALNWWKVTPERVATAFVVDKDGTVYEAFDPKFWAHHLGLRHRRNTELNMRSVGIEIVNEGQLRQKPFGWEWNFVNGTRPQWYRGEGVVSLESPWRGYSHWAAYTDAQYVATSELVKYICEMFGIEPTVCESLDFDMSIPDKYAIYSHRNVIANGKWDVSPAFDFKRLAA